MPNGLFGPQSDQADSSAAYQAAALQVELDRQHALKMRMQNAETQQQADDEVRAASDLEKQS